jgi:transcriptional regulator
VLNGPSGLDGNHLPFELNPDDGERGRLVAHVARANPLWQETKDGDEALVIFRAANAYISPNWYPSKHEFHRQVPTWNYQAVHVHGKIKIRDDERFVRGVVARLTRVNEARTGSDKPWKMTDSSKEYIDQMLSAIVGIEHQAGWEVEAQSEPGGARSHQRGRGVTQAWRAAYILSYAGCFSQP